MSFAGLSIGWSFCGYLAVVIAMAALLHHLRGMPRFFSLICLPGTVGHELLHFLVGTLTLAKPVRVSLIPKFHRDGSATLGFVMFSNVPLVQRALGGFRPASGFARSPCGWCIPARPRFRRCHGGQSPGPMWRRA